MGEFELGGWMMSLARELFPICRSITGEGVRRTLEILRREIPLTVHEVPTGTPVLDWTVPKEWNIREAWVRDPTGRVVVDFADSNLHVVSYSVPVRARMSLERTAAAPSFASRAAGAGSLPHQLLPGNVGLLSGAPGTGTAGARRIRSPDRFDAGRREPELRRIVSSGRDGRRDFVFRARVPPVASR